MKLLKYIPVILSFCLILGILIGYYLNVSSFYAIGLTLLLFFVLVISYFFSAKLFSKNYFFTVITFLLFVSIGNTSISIKNQINKSNHYSNYIDISNKILLVLEKKLKSNNYYDKYIFEVSQLNDIKTIGLVLVNVKQDTAITNSFNIGDTYYLKSKFKKISQPLNPYQFDYQKYLKKQRVYHQITIKDEELYFIESKTSIFRYIEQFRVKIINSLTNNGFKNDELDIIKALVLGQRKEASKELIQNYAGAGAIHILAVSGLHIGILLYILTFAFKPIELLPKGKIIKIVLIIIVLWLYALLAGMSPSIIRAVTMFTAISIGEFSNKKTSTLHSLFISIFFLLLVNPMYLFSVGFQLSYLAVFSIVLFYPLFIEFFNPKFWLFKKIWQLFSVSLSAQLGIFPLSVYYFHQFPSLFFVSNIVVIPFLGIILALGILIITMAVFNILPFILAQFYNLIIHSMNLFIEFIAKQESFLFHNISFSIFKLITSYLIIWSFYWFWKNVKIKKLKFLLISIILFQFVLVFEKHQKQSSNDFIVFNQWSENLILSRNGINTTIYHNIDSINVNTNYVIKNYITEIGGLKMSYKSTKNIFKINDKTMLVVDSLNVYDIPKLKVDYILLKNSPKINLNRLITIINPKLIISDASNYKYLKKIWRKNCIKRNIPYYDTSVDGAFVLRY